MPGLVPGIHVLAVDIFEKTWMAETIGEATSFFERLCPAMTNCNQVIS
jgi:hypothetical protein